MTTYLLDANVLIALTVEEHADHERVLTWVRDVDHVAVCPIVEGALVRFLLRMGESSTVATRVVQALATNPRCQFWADSVSYADVDLTRLQGHKQVTDAYLAALAGSHADVQLATLDQALSDLRPDLAHLIQPD